MVLKETQVSFTGFPLFIKLICVFIANYKYLYNMEQVNIIEGESVSQNNLFIQEELIPCVELNKTFHHTITNYGFDNLSIALVNEIYRDGRVFSHFIEHWLTTTYPLVHISGCKDHDFIDPNNSEIIFDEKTFTKGGCKFMPSNMIGTGRTFNQSDFEEKANKLIYCIVSNIHFPEIKIRFIRGYILMKKYPKGIIHLKDHDELFHST
jgi:hypothetical protein